MPKPSFRDIVPPENRSIKRIPLPHRDRDDEPEPKRAPRYSKTRSGKSFHPLFTAIIFLAVIGGGIYFFVSQVSGASLTVTPKIQNVPVDIKSTATASASGELPYQTVSYQKDGKLAVPADGEEDAQVKASGKIRIFNSFSSASQKLVANTRFESNGKIFRIKEPVTVPGTNGGTPGSVDVLVFADAVGDKYNVGLADFTIPGFKDDPRYEKIFARSVEPISGGFSGTRKKVDQAVLNEAREKIHAEMEASFVKQIKQNIPSTFVFLDNAYFISFQSLPNSTSTEGAMIVERATFHGIIFKRSDVASVLAKKIKNVDIGSSTFSGIDDLKFSISDASAIKPWQSASFIFSLKGEVAIVSDVDIDSLKSALAGKNKKDLSLILRNYPSVEKAEVTMRPFWNQDFPDDIKNLSISVASTTSSP